MYGFGCLLPGEGEGENMATCWLSGHNANLVFAIYAALRA